MSNPWTSFCMKHAHDPAAPPPRNSKARSAPVAALARFIPVLLVSAIATPSLSRKISHIPRRISGCNLDDLLHENGFQVARALVGTEGTCAYVVSATLNLTASPPFRVLTALAFPDAFLAADAVPRMLDSVPSVWKFDGMLSTSCAERALPSTMLRCFPKVGAFCSSRWAPGMLSSSGQAESRCVPRKALARICPFPAFISPRGCGAYGMCANALWARWFLSPASPTVGRVGKMLPFRPRSWALTCASSSR